VSAWYKESEVVKPTVVERHVRCLIEPVLLPTCFGNFDPFFWEPALWHKLRRVRREVPSITVYWRGTQYAARSGENEYSQLQVGIWTVVPTGTTLSSRISPRQIENDDMELLTGRQQRLGPPPSAVSSAPRSAARAAGESFR
jgi:hypothetical protein